MKPKQTRKRNEEYKNLVNSLQDAQFIFRTLFTDYTEDTLTNGVHLWLEKTKDPIALRLFLNLPELIELYGIEDFLDGRIDIPEVDNKQSMRNARLAACLLYLIATCWKLFGEKIHKQPACSWPLTDVQKTDLDSIHKTLGKISLDDVQMELSKSLMLIVGRPYFKLFFDKLKPFDNNKMNKRDTKKFDNEPALKPHMQLMLWMSIMRIFLDAVYFYFGKENNTIQMQNTVIKELRR